MLLVKESNTETHNSTTLWETWRFRFGKCRDHDLYPGVDLYI